MNWTPEPFHVWWRSMVHTPEPAPDPKVWNQMQAEARRLHTQFQERRANLALARAGVTVTLAKEAQ
jgi:hypothetical protein